MRRFVAGIDRSQSSLFTACMKAAVIRASWPVVRILLRADSGFARENLKAWCEAEAKRRGRRTFSRPAPVVNLES